MDDVCRSCSLLMARMIPASDTCAQAKHATVTIERWHELHADEDVTNDRITFVNGAA